MNKGDYEKLITEGEAARETGNLEAATSIFLKALLATSVPQQVSNAKRHLGLCYEHGENLFAAETQYKEALEISQKEGDLAGMARTKRHLLSIELKRGNYEVALLLGEAARKHMIDMGAPPSDLVWITHGIVKCLIGGKFSRASVRAWTKCELADLRYMWPIERNQIRKRVWLTGFLMDASYAWAPWAWLLLPIAFVIALFSGLKLRLRQMLTRKR